MSVVAERLRRGRPARRELYDVTITGTGSFLPGDPLDNATLERLAGPVPADVLSEIQVLTRHWMIDPATGAHRYSTSEMAERATRQALQRAGVDIGDVDLLVVSTASPEHPLPATVTSLQARLGLPRAATMELRSGCAGAVQAMDLARRYLEDGTHRTAVVVGSESISPLFAPLFVGIDPARVRLRDRMNIFTFGDGAGAVVLQGGEPNREDGAGVMGSSNACLGGDRSPGMQIVGSGTDAPIADQLRRKRMVDLKVDLVQSAEFGPRMFVTALRDLLSSSGLTLDDVDVCVVPEGNAGYFSSELERSGMTRDEYTRLQPTIVENLAAVGATGSAAVPVALDDGWVRGRIRPGDNVLLLGIEASRWIAAGLALTWTAAGP